MDLDITFEGKTMCTPVYIKMDAADQLLLSEGVCRQLGVITFHSKVEKWRGHRKKETDSPPLTPSTQEPPMSELNQEEATPEAKVPSVRVNLVHSVHLLPHQSQVVEVSLDGQVGFKQPLLLDGTQLTCGIDVDTSLISMTADGMGLTVLSNPTGCSMTVDEGSLLGAATPVEAVEPQPETCHTDRPQTDPGSNPAACNRSQEPCFCVTRALKV